MQVRTVALMAALLTALLQAGDDSTSVRIDSGTISGAVADGIRVYKGVPFAAPPVGDLRWKPPQAVKAWDGVRPCLEYSAWCPQPKPLMGKELGKLSEDCLYLNVWTPAKVADDKLPVMVWIHGGGCTTGSGGSSYYDGTNFARQGIVLVTINYRLGPFGFFAHPLLSKESERGVSGNYGFLDQIAALQWVQRNIVAFGGDSGCVTIFGESAGSASVCRLMVSPLAKGLFHRAIAQSGGAHGGNRKLRGDGVGPRNMAMEKVGEQLAARLGCDKEPDPLAALRAKSAEDILDAADAAQGLFGKGTKFGWIVDGWALPDDPGRLFDAGKQADVPFMLGSNADEGTIFLQQLPIKRAVGYKLLLRTWFRDGADQLLKLFPVESDEDVPGALNKMVTASAFVAPNRALARDMEQCKSKAYLYHFTRVPPFAEQRKLGAFHAVEIAYVFGNLRDGPMYAEKDRELSKVVSAAWVRFAKAGDPNGEGLPPWPVFTRDGDQHMEFGDEVQVKSGLFKAACDALEKRVHAGGDALDAPQP